MHKVSLAVAVKLQGKVSLCSKTYFVEAVSNRDLNDYISTDGANGI